MLVTITSTAYFANPLILKDWKRQVNQIAVQPCEIEDAYILINQGLDHFIQAFSLATYQRKNVNIFNVFIFLSYIALEKRNSINQFNQTSARLPKGHRNIGIHSIQNGYQICSLKIRSYHLAS